ncbi:hypothetical protein [Sinimarinibacterium thermocellulolyticum]|uniref:hypothetical protein n=1 Tax=Sinimarinibacterium thermocellulolyticum TaxID=3170016 RepID=UPI003DA1568D
MKRYAVAAVLVLSASAAHAQIDSVDESPSAAAMAFDFAVVRPLGLVATVGGIALFIAQLPFALIQGEPPSEPARRFVVEPAAYTFSRPLGELE